MSQENLASIIEESAPTHDVESGQMNIKDSANVLNYTVDGSNSRFVPVVKVLQKLFTEKSFNLQNWIVNCKTMRGLVNFTRFAKMQANV